MNTQRILVLGAGGFVGRAIVERLRTRREVITFAAERGRANGARLEGQQVRADITIRQDLERAMQEVRPDVVINATGYGVDPKQRTLEMAIAVNVTGAAYVVETAAAVGCRRVLHIGSCSEYGASDGTVNEQAATLPTDLYGGTKAAGSLLVLERGRFHAMEASVLRLFNVWGENEPAHRLFPALWEACRSFTPLDLTDGRQIKDYSYVGDVADWLIDLALLPHPIGADVINLASGLAMPLREFAQRVATHLGHPELLRFGALGNRPQEARSQIPDVALLNRLLPSRRVTPIEDALDQMLANAAPARGLRHV